MPGIVLLLPVESLPHTGTSGRLPMSATMRARSASAMRMSWPSRKGRTSSKRPLFRTLMNRAKRCVSSTDRLMLSYML